MPRSAAPTQSLLGLFLLFLAPLAQAQPAPVVGQLGDLSRLQLQGLKIISPADLGQALLSDADFQLASTPSAPLEDFLRITRAQLELGCLRSGFPHAKVEVSADPAQQSLLVKIDEGPRLNAGEIEIDGAGPIDAPRLKDYLLKGSEAGQFPLHLANNGAQVTSEGDPDKPKTPLWEPGSPAPLDPLAIDRFNQDVRAGLALQGFFASRFSVATRPNGDRAQLVIHFDDPGPRAVLGETEVTGAIRNRPDEILRFLKLSRGMSLDSHKLQALQASLWDSARFWRHTLTMTRLDNDPRQVRLKIDLVEHDTAPAISQELLVEQTALLRCAAWFQASINSGSELVFEATDHSHADARLIMHPSHGIVARLKPVAKPKSPQPATQPDDFVTRLARLDTAVVFSSNQIGFYDLANRDRAVCDAHGAQFPIELSLKYIPTAGEKKATFFIAFATNSKSDSNPGTTLQVRIAPVCILNLFRNDPTHKVDAQIKDGIFTLAMAGATFRCDSQTGRFIEMIVEQQNYTYRITLDPGALQREIDALQQALPAQKSAGGEPTPASEVLIAGLTAFLRERSSSGSPRARLAGARALRKLLGHASAILSQYLTSDDADFHIPADPKKYLRSAGNPFGILLATVPWTDRLSTRGSWPWTLTRETLLILSGSAKYTHLEAGRMMSSPDLGPVGCLAIARTYLAASDPVSARIFAKRGLERLNLDFFHKDCQALFAGHSPQASVFAAVASSLGQMSAEEIDSLAVLLGQPGANILQAVAKAQGAAPQGSPALLLQPLQDAAWDAGIKNFLESALNALANAR